MFWKKRKKKGAVLVCDHEGKACRRPIPPERMKDWINSGKAKRVYKVLIKGLAFDGSIKEEFWELSEEDRNQFVCNDDTAYVLCHFENGEPQFFFIAKILWDNLDEVSEIMTDPVLTQAQRIAKIEMFVK